MTQFKGDPKWYPVCAIPLVVLCLLVATSVGKAAALWEAHRYGPRPAFPVHNGPSSGVTTAAIPRPIHSCQPLDLAHAKTQTKSDIESAEDAVERNGKLPVIIFSHTSSEATSQCSPLAGPGSKDEKSPQPQQRESQDGTVGDLEHEHVTLHTHSQALLAPALPALRSSHVAILERQNSGVSYEAQKRLGEMLGDHFGQGNKRD